MSEIFIELATPQDNEELLQLMAEMPMPGFVKVAYHREPNFFDALSVAGHFNQTIIGRDTASGKIIGMGTRSIKPAFINGQKQNVGYLSGLRMLPEHRGRFHLAKGYKLLHDLHRDGKAPLYLTTILNDNSTAMKLTKPRRRLPVYHDIGQIKSMALSTSRKLPAHKPGGLHMRTALPEDLQELVRFLNHEGRKKQFFPAYSEDDFLRPQGLLRDMSFDDIYMAYRDGELVGVLAAWDQKAYRQSVVKGYDRKVAWARPAYNMWARLTGLPTLPPAGTTLNYFYLSMICIKDDNENIFLNLLRMLLRDKRDYSFMMAGMHEHSPLLATLNRFRHVPYLSRLCAVCWDDGERLFANLLARPPYLELGSL